MEDHWSLPIFLEIGVMAPDYVMTELIDNASAPSEYRNIVFYQAEFVAHYPFPLICRIAVLRWAYAGLGVSFMPR